MAHQTQSGDRLSWVKRDQPGGLVACSPGCQLYHPQRAICPSRLEALRSGVEEEGNRACRGGSEKDARVCAECELGHYWRLYARNSLLYRPYGQELCSDGEL